MKKKIISVFVILLITSVLLTGCDSDAINVQISNNNERESGADGDKPNSNVKIDVDYNQEAKSDNESVNLVTIAPEIMESSLGAELYQVYNAVIKTDGSVTVKEAFDAIQQGIDFKVSLDLNYGETVDGIHYKYYYVKDDAKKIVCSIVSCYNTESDADDLGLRVIDMEAGEGIHFYNCILPSGVVPVFNNSSDPKTDVEVAAYNKRLEEIGGEVTFDKIEDWLRNHGVTHIQNADYKKAYIFAVFPTIPIAVLNGTEEFYKTINWKVKYNSEERLCEIDRSVSIERKGIWVFDTATPYVSELGDTIKNEAIARAEDAIDNHWNYGNKVSGLEFKMFAISANKKKREVLYTIFIDDQQRYVATNVNVTHVVGGDVTISSVEQWDGKFFNSIEECMKEYELTLVED